MKCVACLIRVGINSVLYFRIDKSARGNTKVDKSIWRAKNSDNDDLKILHGFRRFFNAFTMNG